jgi:hypothetical protein
MPASASSIAREEPPNCVPQLRATNPKSVAVLISTAECDLQHGVEFAQR